MRKARSVTRAAPLLGALSFALLLVGCADDAAPPTSIKKAPTGAVATRAIDLTRRPDLRATVKTVATFRSKDGKILKKEFSQKVKATFKRGLARATREGTASDGASATFASLAPGAAQFAQFTSGDGTYTPVIAAVSGTLANDYYDSQTDSVGNVSRFMMGRRPLLSAN